DFIMRNPNVNGWSKGLLAVSFCLCILVTSTLAGQTTSHQSSKSSTKSEETPEVIKRLDSAANVLDEIMGTPDKAIPKNVLADAKCRAVIPSMVNIAGGFGGRHGKGFATCRTANGWSAPAPIDITGGSFGLQIGGEAVDLVMLAMNQKGMQALLSSKFK